MWNSGGKIQGNSDVELAPEGIRQAKLLAEKCPFENVDAVYSSDLVRAVVTAKTLADKFNLPVQLVPELREVNFGTWEGRSLPELEKTDPDNFDRFFNRPEELRIEEAETFQETQDRAVIAMNKIIAAHHNDEDSQIIVVAHGAINRLILCAFLEIPLRKMWAISQYNTCVNILREDDGKITVNLINSTAHLDKLDSFW